MRPVITFIRSLAREWTVDEVPRRAAAIAYYSIFSLPAMLLSVVSIAGFFLRSRNIEEEFFAQAASFMAPRTLMFIQNAVDNIRIETSTPLFRLITILTLAAGALIIFRELSSALNHILQQHDQRTHTIIRRLRNVILAIVLLVLTGILLTLSLIGGTIVTFLHRYVSAFVMLPFDSLAYLNALLLFFFLCLLFLSLYMLIPVHRFSWPPAIVGSCITSFLFVAGTTMLTLYLSSSNLGHAYGVAATLLFLLMWIYYSALIFLLGAEIIDLVERKAWLPPPVKIVRKAKK